MIRRVDPLADARDLIPRVYAYVAYRLGDGPEAEDVVSATFERAVRYRAAYDPQRGAPIAWLIGIAKHCLNDAVGERRRNTEFDELADLPADVDVEGETLDRLTLRRAITRLSERDQELLSLRYGAGLSARDIGTLIDAKTNAVEVALHRMLGRLRSALEKDAGDEPTPVGGAEAPLLE
ncbi:MAG TPA: sigma-70 family RNA polymerase sigma factor [Gaiellaceae bacterium]|nr:sigma-70 family RNA polymerase sigma factor [Gaiellaceae bacterium]